VVVVSMIAPGVRILPVCRPAATVKPHLRCRVPVALFGRRPAWRTVTLPEMGSSTGFHRDRGQCRSRSELAWCRGPGR